MILKGMNLQSVQLLQQLASPPSPLSYISCPSCLSKVSLLQSSNPHIDSLDVAVLSVSVPDLVRTNQQEILTGRLNTGEHRDEGISAEFLCSRCGVTWGRE